MPAGLRAVQVQGGDRIRILTPGGGGFGPAEGAPGQQQHSGGAAEVQQLVAAVDSQVAAKRRRTGSAEFSVPLRDGGSVQRYVQNQETA